MSKEEAKKASETKAAPVDDMFGEEMPRGFDEGGVPDVDGWWSPKPGLVFQGEICGYFAFEDRKNKGKEREAVTVRLSKPTLAVVDKKEVKLEAGMVLAVGISYRLRELLEYVEHKGSCWVKALDKKDIGGGQSMWQYKTAFNGRKGAPPTSRNAAADDDKAPF